MANHCSPQTVQAGGESERAARLENVVGSFGGGLMNSNPAKRKAEYEKAQPSVDHKQAKCRRRAMFSEDFKEHGGPLPPAACASGGRDRTSPPLDNFLEAD